MAKLYKSHKEKKINNRIVFGTIGVLISILGLFFAITIRTSDILISLIFLIMVIFGVILVAKALSD